MCSWRLPLRNAQKKVCKIKSTYIPEPYHCGVHHSTFCLWRCSYRWMKGGACRSWNQKPCAFLIIQELLWWWFFAILNISVANSVTQFAFVYMILFGRNRWWGRHGCKGVLSIACACVVRIWTCKFAKRFTVIDTRGGHCLISVCIDMRE